MKRGRKSRRRKNSGYKMAIWISVLALGAGAAYMIFKKKETGETSPLVTLIEQRAAAAKNIVSNVTSALPW